MPKVYKTTTSEFLKQVEDINEKELKLYQDKQKGRVPH